MGSTAEKREVTDTVQLGILRSRVAFNNGHAGVSSADSAPLTEQAVQKPAIVAAIPIHPELPTLTIRHRVVNRARTS